MRATLKVAAICIVVCTSAQAQTSVTLYGLIDDGLLYNTNAKGGHQYALNASNLQGDRWGLRGSEDLGGGLSTIFVLENGYTLNTGTLGQGGDEFGRQAYVGLRNGYGSLTFGRQYDSLAEGVGGFTFGNSAKQGGAGQLGGVVGMHVGDIDNLDNTYRVNNAIKYVSPVYRGFLFVGEYGLGGVAGDFSRNQIWSVSTSYSGGALSAGVGFEKINDPNFSFYGNNATSSATANNVTTPVYSGYMSAKTQQIATGGASYTFGDAVIGAVYSNVRFTDLGAVSGTGLNPGNLSGTAAFNIGELSVAYHVTTAWLVGAAYTYTHGASLDGKPAAKYQEFELASDYVLSKRTDFYTLVAMQRASGVDSTLHPAVAAMNGLTPSSTNKQLAVIFGIRTHF